MIIINNSLSPPLEKNGGYFNKKVEGKKLKKKKKKKKKEKKKKLKIKIHHIKSTACDPAGWQPVVSFLKSVERSWSPRTWPAFSFQPLEDSSTFPFWNAFWKKNFFFPIYSLFFFILFFTIQVQFLLRFSSCNVPPITNCACIVSPISWLGSIDFCYLK